MQKLIKKILFWGHFLLGSTMLTNQKTGLFGVPRQSAPYFAAQSTPSAPLQSLAQL